VLEGKRLGLLHELVPAAALIAALLNPTNANFQAQLRGIQDAARAAGQQVNILSARTERDIDTAFETAIESRAGALLVGSDPFFNSQRDQVVRLAARRAIPAIYEGREFAMAGGLASYGTSLADTYRELAFYTARILKGAKPSDLPVAQSSKFEFVLNLKTARALRLSTCRLGCRRVPTRSLNDVNRSLRVDSICATPDFRNLAARPYFAFSYG
jgi:putative tryptophan/tyrosine transport system substrate-binding protein